MKKLYYYKLNMLKFKPINKPNLTISFVIKSLKTLKNAVFNQSKYR